MEVPASDIQHVLYHKSNETEKDILAIVHEQKEKEVVAEVVAYDRMGKKLSNDNVLRHVRSFYAEFHLVMKQNEYRMMETHKRKEVEKLARVHSLMGKEADEKLLNILFSYAISVPNIRIYPYWLSDVHSWDYEYYDVVTTSFDVGVFFFLFSFFTFLFFWN
jgi:sulfur relay (sulfurtransferase) DsrC/TusE family protein